MGQIQVQKVENYQKTPVDFLSMAMVEVYDGPDCINRLYKGVFTQPYHLIQDNNIPPDGVMGYCDEISDNQPMIYGWRFWGKKTELILDSLNRMGLQLSDLPKLEERKDSD